MTRAARGIAVLALLCACGSPPNAVDPQPERPQPARPSDAAVAGPDAAAPSDAAVPAVPTTRLPGEAKPIGYDLRLELDPASPAFTGHAEISVELQHATDRVWLHAEHLDIATASWRAGSKTGALTELAIDNEHDIHGWSFGAQLSGTVTLVFDYTGKVVREHAEGLFRQLQGAKWYVYAQSESVFARRILPCFDEPRWKPRWKVAIVAPKAMVAIANGGELDHVDRPDGKRETHFAEVASMPSYLLSVAVGPFAVIDTGKVGRGKLPTRVVVPADQRNVGVVSARLPSIVDALENYLDAPLPIAKLDLVAVPRFFGAMENIGLITFESNLLVGDPRRDFLWRRFIRFAAHELAHQWFGNFVTQAWWDDLWLAEGFATWLGDKIGDDLGAANDAAVRRQLERMHALDADDDDEPRPLRRPIDADNVEDRFDAIAYEKGGAVLVMLEQFVGPDKFRDVLRGYVRAHANGSATSSDVVATFAMTEPAAAAALTTYLDIAGAPVVTLRLDCKANKLEVRAANGTVPVCVRYPEGADPKRACVAATPTTGSIALASCPAWVIGNAGGEGYYHVADPALAANAPVTPSEQLAYASDIAAGVGRGDLPLATAIGELRAGVTRDPVSRLGAVSIAQAIDPLVDDATRPAWTKFLAQTFQKKPYKVKLSIPAPTVGAVDGEVRERLAELLDTQQGTKAGFDRIVARAKQADEDHREDVLENLGLYGAKFAPALVDLYLDKAFKPASVWPAISNMLDRADTRTAIWKALAAKLPIIIATVSARDLDKLIEGTHALCDATSRAQVVAAFTNVSSSDKLPTSLAGIDRCIARRARLGDLAAALRP